MDGVGRTGIAAVRSGSRRRGAEMQAGSSTQARLPASGGAPPWRGQSIGLVVASRTWSASCLNCMRCGSIYFSISRARHHDACWQGPVPDDGRVCRVRKINHPGTCPRWAKTGQERGKTSGQVSTSPRTSRANPRSSEQARAHRGVRRIAARFGVDPSTVQRISRPFDASVGVA